MDWLGQHWWDWLVGTGVLAVLGGIALFLHHRLAPRVHFGSAVQRNHHENGLSWWHLFIRLEPSKWRLWEKQELKDAIVLIEVEEENRWREWPAVFLKSDTGPETTPQCTIGHDRAELIPIAQRTEGNGRASAILTDQRFFAHQTTTMIGPGDGKQRIRLQLRCGGKRYFSEPYYLRVRPDETNRRFRLEEIYGGGGMQTITPSPPRPTPGRRGRKSFFCP